MQLYVFTKIVKKISHGNNNYSFFLTCDLACLVHYRNCIPLFFG